MTTHQTDPIHNLLSIAGHLPKSDHDLITRAYTSAKQAHHNQERLSGDPYFTHAYATAVILAELGMDAPTIVAGLLHDTIEDGKATQSEIEKQFGKEISYLVQGVTKLGKLQYHGLKRHVESLRKLFVATTRDIRVLIIKLADRLHNMRTLEHVPTEKQERIALETLEIYAPLAHRLGIGKLKGELEDLAFKFAYPKEYQEARVLLKERSKEDVQQLEKVSRRLQRKIHEAGITITTIDYRTKHLYSFYKKLVRQEMNIDKVYDIAALRIIVETVEECYHILGIIHNLYKPLPGRIKDYIATPKANGYQSLHTTVFTGDGGIVEIQIRTHTMHQEAEYGAASHVMYKEGAGDESLSWALQLLSPFTNTHPQEKNQPTAPDWIQELTELHEDITNPTEFLKSLKDDFFDERVFVFTPKGEVVDLPVGATPIDFAYAIHSDLGDHLAGAKVNGKLVSLNTPIKNGDIVEIETKKNAHPTQKWLEQAKTVFAKRKIRSALQKTK